MSTLTSSPGPAEARIAPCLAVPAGSAVLFSALLWHYSKGNETDEVRRVLIVSYQEATVAGGNGSRWKVLREA